MLACPNNHKIDHVLVCGGPTDPNEVSEFFQMTLNGKYTNLLADGTVGVTKEMKEHADEGCATEPICPICKAECVEQLPANIKFEVGDTYSTERDVAIANHLQENVDEPLEYPKGEVFEVLDIIQSQGETLYNITFWLDSNQTFNGESIIHQFDKDTLTEWLTEDNEDL